MTSIRSILAFKILGILGFSDLRSVKVVLKGKQTLKRKSLDLEILSPEGLEGPHGP